MGIVKAASGVATADSSGDEGLMREERLLLQSFPSQGSDDCEQAEVDCELVMSGGQVCNVPYGLYDLPELKDVLSLEGWNLCLTEDDRFRLAAYLPDMDQEDLFTTLTELFSGSAMFFGSPLGGFFDRLSGGFYSPEVSQARELLADFQRRKYYHFLRLYHNGMVWKFTCMDRLLRTGMSTSLEEKIHIWHTWIHEKPLTFVDPNSSLMNASPPIITSSSLLMRAKLMEGTSTTNCSAKHKEIVHRVKSMEMGSSTSHVFRSQDEPDEKCGKLPKGVLKTKSDYDALADVNEGIHHTPGLIPLTHHGVQVSTFSLYAFPQHMHNYAVSPSYPYYMNTSRTSLGSSSSSPWQREGALETYPLLVKGPSGVQHTFLEELKRGSHSAMLRGYESAYKPGLAYSNEANGTRESTHEKNLLKSFGQRSAMNPADPYARTILGHQRNVCTKMPSPRNADRISGMLTLSTSTNPPCNNLLGQSETMHKHHDGLETKAPSVTKVEEEHRFPNTYTNPPCNNLLGQSETMHKHHDGLETMAPSVTKVEEEHRFPNTYTRRKLQRGVDLGDHVKTPTMVGSESASVLSSMTNVKAKAIKL
jgi:hypothetical protein